MSEPSQSTRPSSLSLELQATPEEVMRGVEILETFCQEREVPPSLIFGLMLALEEMSSNIVNHAYGRDPLQKFNVAIEHLGDRIVMETRDHGPAFNPLTTPLPTAEPGSEDLREGGVGIYLAHHYLTNLSYARDGEQNVLRMTKLLPGADPAKSDAAH